MDKNTIYYLKKCKTFLKSNIGKMIKNEHQKFTIKLIKFARDDPLGFSYVESKLSSRKVIKEKY